MALIDRISLGPQVCKHMMSPAGCSFVSHSADVNRRNYDSLAGTGRGLCKHPSIVIDNLASAWPGVRWVHFQTSTLVRADNISNVFQRAAAIHHSPPVHRFGSTPRI